MKTLARPPGLIRLLQRIYRGSANVADCTASSELLTQVCAANDDYEAAQGAQIVLESRDQTGE